MIRNLATSFIISSFLTNAVAQSQVSFYVSSTGSDENSGANDTPSLTTARAQQAVQAVSDDQKNIVVQTLPEAYYLEEPLRFGPEEGGSATRTVTYRRGGEEVVLIHSGKTVTGWQVNDRPDIYQAEVSDARFRQLYASHQKAVRARYPNSNQYLKSLAWDYKDWQLVIMGKHSALAEIGFNMKMLHW